MQRTLFLFYFLAVFVNALNANDFVSYSKLEVPLEKLQEKQGVKLDKGWSFYWNQLLMPNQISQGKLFDTISLKNWTNFTDNQNNPLPSLGYATYRLQFSVPENSPNLSLYVPRIIGAYKLWINGKLAMELGKVGTSKSTTLHRRFTKIIPLNSLETNFEVVIQVANFYNKKAGIDEPILIGETKHMLAKQALQNRTDMVFIGSLSFIGILFLVFFFVFWNKDRAVLYFSTLCLAMAYHTLNDHYAPLAQLFENLSWIFVTKTEYIAAHLIGISGSLFIAKILSKFIHKLYKKTIVTAILCFSILVIVLPAPHFTRLIVPYLILLLLNILYIIGISLYAIKLKAYFSKLLIICIGSAAIIFTIQIFSYIYDRQDLLVYVKFGDILLFLSISFLLMQRFSNAFKSLEVSRNLVLSQKIELLNVNENLSETINELENSNKELHDFNHIVSHDLKSPLVSIHSLTDLIERDLKDKLEENTTTYMKFLKDSVAKMDASINGLLDYSKATRNEKKRTLIHLNTLLDDIVSYIGYKDKIEIHLPEEDLEIYANKIELEHVFQNLISNSIKYNDKEKTIIEIQARFNEKEQLYHFSVKDNGPGIHEKYHTKMFEIFNQNQYSEKRKDSTGIGLAIVKRIVTKNFGEITVESKENEGLTINFTWKVKNETT